MALTCGFTLTILKYKTIRLRFSIGIWTMHSYADDPEPTHKVLIPTSDIFWNYFSRLSNTFQRVLGHILLLEKFRIRHFQDLPE